MMRLIFGIFLLVNYLQGDGTKMRVVLHFAGELWHFLILIIAWRFPVRLQPFHSANLILSYGLFVFNKVEDFIVTDIITSLLGLFMVQFVSGILINTGWIYTNMASIAVSVSAIAFYSEIHSLDMG